LIFLPQLPLLFLLFPPAFIQVILVVVSRRVSELIVVLIAQQMDAERGSESAQVAGKLRTTVF